jgi:phage shock protein E
MIKLLVFKIIVLVLLIGVISFYFFSKNNDFADPIEMKNIVKQGALLLDVRSLSEFKARHIKGAVNIPVDEIESKMGEIVAKDKAIVVYCQSGVRSARAQKLLQKQGFLHVYNLGGIKRWPH